jgi:hypothetical protein
MASLKLAAEKRLSWMKVGLGFQDWDMRPAPARIHI